MAQNFYFQESDVIIMVKQKIYQQTGILVMDQRLYDEANVYLYNMMTLSEFGIEHGSEIDLFYAQTGC